MTYSIPIDHAYQVDPSDIRLKLASLRREKLGTAARRLAQSLRLSVDAALVATCFYAGLHADMLIALMRLC